MAQKRKPLTEASIQEDFDPQAVEQLREQLNLPTVKPNNPLTVNTESVPESQSERSSLAQDKTKTDRPKKINIDIGESRHNRLNELAARIRANNTDPVAPSERMYPIHLIQIAIDFLLDGVEIDWDKIQKPDDLRKVLNGLRVEQLNC
ncbi:MAG: hypothetical protein HC780_19870 [Leptolyngbyaceae cyanobacterium CSU_1_3]|nr:hypothetical protein [Leptolyngbyaceae cyanobacterium CSU_1_3]